MQRVYLPQSYFEYRHCGKRFNNIEKFKSLTFQLRAIYFHTFADDMTVYCMYNVYCIVYSVYYTLYTIQYTIYIQYTLYIP